MRRSHLRLTVLALCAILVALQTSTLLADAVITTGGPRYQAPPLDLSRVRGTEPRPPVDKVSEHLYSVAGLPVVVAWGSPFERGKQFGAALAPQVKGAIETYLQKGVIEQQGFSREYLLQCANAMLPQIPTEFVQEMKGVAAGAGVDYTDILLLHCHADIVHYGKGWPSQGPGASAAPAACSNFAVWGSRTDSGRCLHGRNLDWGGHGAQRFACVYVCVPDKGYPFALVTWAGGIGGVTGMNSRGISLGQMTSSSSRESLAGMPLFFVTRQILQYCGSIGEAGSVLKRCLGTTGWNYLITDGKIPTARAFEVDAGQTTVFGPNDPKEQDEPVAWAMRDCVRRTNHFIDRQMQAKQAKRYGIADVKLARALAPMVDSWQRYAALSQWIDRNMGNIDERVARAMLQTAPVAVAGNLQSVVFDSTNRVLWVANATEDRPAWSQPYVELRLDDLLKRAGKPQTRSAHGG